jgi:hypothetical protein
LNPRQKRRSFFFYRERANPSWSDERSFARHGFVTAPRLREVEPQAYRPKKKNQDGTGPMRKMHALAALLSGSALIGACPSRAKPVFTVVYSFMGETSGVIDAASPTGALGYANGAIYGTSYYGGKRIGTGYAVTTAGKELFVSSLNDSTGYLPNSGVTQGTKLFYGAGTMGGLRNCEQKGCGTLFTITDKGKLKKLLAFPGGAAGSSNGIPPINVGGTLYGVAGGGANGDSIFYSIAPGGAYTVLYSFGNGTDGV